VDDEGKKPCIVANPPYLPSKLNHPNNKARMKAKLDA